MALASIVTQLAAGLGPEARAATVEPADGAFMAAFHFLGSCERKLQHPLSDQSPASLW